MLNKLKNLKVERTSQLVTQWKCYKPFRPKYKMLKFMYFDRSRNFIRKISLISHHFIFNGSTWSIIFIFNFQVYVLLFNFQLANQVHDISSAHSQLEFRKRMLLPTSYARFTRALNELRNSPLTRWSTSKLISVN